MPTNKGWRRLWPSTLWLQTFTCGGSAGAFGGGGGSTGGSTAGDRWNWTIWSSDRERKLACGAEDYSRSQAAAFAGVKFGAEQLRTLEEAERRRSGELQAAARLSPLPTASTASTAPTASTSPTP